MSPQARASIAVLRINDPARMAHRGLLLAAGELGTS
jgi:hypothetical protein